MKLRSVLNGIAALSIVGMFYAFAFGIKNVEEIDTVMEFQTEVAEPDFQVENAEAFIDRSNMEPVKEMKPELPVESEEFSISSMIGSGYGYEAAPETKPSVVITPLYGGYDETETTTVPQRVIYQGTYETREMTTAEEPAVTTVPDYALEEFTYASSETTEFVDYGKYLFIHDAENITTTWYDPGKDYVVSDEPEFTTADVFAEYREMTQTEETTAPYDSGYYDYQITFPTYTYDAPAETTDVVYSEQTTFDTDYDAVTSETTSDSTVTTTENTTVITYDEFTGAEIFTARVGGVEQEFNAYDLTCMIVANEMSPYFNQEALKAQAVAAYSYVKYHNVKGLVPSVLVKENIPDEIRTAVDAVFGKCCYYDGKPAQTVYTASTAGTTACAENVWGGDPVPYLSSVQTPFDLTDDPNFGEVVQFTAEDVRSRLERNLDIVLSEDPADWITVVSNIDGRYVNEVNIDNQYIISGRKMRESIFSYKLKSWAFDVSYADGIFTFTTYGYGHGVGMSQNGANYLGKQGYTYDEILRFYFTGVTVE